MDKKIKTILVWVLHIIPSIILLQTLFYKFSGSPESVYIFSTIGMEPWGRYGVGIGELFAGVLLLIPRFAWAGALMAIGLMLGAIFFHVAFLGIEVMGDGGYLFFLAIAVLLCSLGVLIIRKKQIPYVNPDVKFL